LARAWVVRSRAPEGRSGALVLLHWPPEPLWNAESELIEKSTTRTGARAERGSSRPAGRRRAPVRRRAMGDYGSQRWTLNARDRSRRRLSGGGRWRVSPRSGSGCSTRSVVRASPGFEDGPHLGLEEYASSRQLVIACGKRRAFLAERANATIEEVPASRSAKTSRSASWTRAAARCHATQPAWAVGARARARTSLAATRLPVAGSTQRGRPSRDRGPTRPRAPAPSPPLPPAGPSARVARRRGP
jgi:hypothetical protein